MQFIDQEWEFTSFGIGQAVGGNTRAVGRVQNPKPTPQKLLEPRRALFCSKAWW